MPLPPEFRVTETDGTLRIAWSNRDVAKDGCVAAFMILFWLIWTPTTLFCTAALVVLIVRFPLDAWAVCNGCFFSVWLIFGWTGVLLVPYSLLGRRWTEMIEVSCEAITHTQTGWLAPKPKVYPLGNVAEFALGWFRNGPGGVSDHVSQVGLYVSCNGEWTRTSRMLGYWLNPELKEQVFLEIKRFVTANDIPLKTREWGDPPTRATDSAESQVQASAPEDVARLAAEEGPKPPQTPLPPTFRVTETAGTLRVEWGYAAIHKNGCTYPLLTMAWLFWAFCTFWATGQLIDTVIHFGAGETICFLAFWLFFGWFGTLWPLYEHFSRYWVESVTVTRDSLTHARIGRFAPKPRAYPLEQVDRIAFGWDRARPEGGEEITTAIHIFWKDGKRSSGIGKWVRDDHLFGIFQHIQRFLASNDVPVRTPVWGEREPWLKYWHT